MEIATASGIRTVQALHAQEGRFRPVEDPLAEEGALQIILDGAPFSMTMRTPGHDGDLALGLLHGEGMLSSWDEVEDVTEASAAKVVAGSESEVESEPDGGCHDAVAITLRSKGAGSRRPAERRLVSNASCGICGKVSADDLAVPALRASDRSVKLDLGMLPALEARMRSAQALFGRTGGTHAAAVFDGAGRLLAIREDVGRHNAVDKAIGHLLREGALGQAAILFISGRVSYEIVSKAAKARIPFLLAVSAPSTLAVKLCREAGISLLAFCRGGKATVYSHPDRVLWGGAALAAEAGEAA